MEEPKYTFLTTNINYEEYLANVKNYYNLKSKYEDYKNKQKSKILNANVSIDNKRKMFAQLKVNCVNCGLIGGTIFNEKNNSLTAKCNVLSKPCDLNINIEKYEIYNLKNEINNAFNKLENIKKDFIKTKLDFLFKYIEEEKAIEVFEDLKKNLSSSQNEFNELMYKYNNIAYNESNNNFINEKIVEQHKAILEFKELLNFYKNSDSNKYLIEALEFYNVKLLTITKTLRTNKYAVNNIEFNNENNEHTLIQDKFNINMMELIKSN
jgi:hypothetical protein